ncbi:MAG: hypothetical protein GEU73_13410 [Chloroflexi bacterium]|nr:hypothetical protein [Chloroflexota bacterium]
MRTLRWGLSLSAGEHMGSLRRLLICASAVLLLACAGPAVRPSSDPAQPPSSRPRTTMTMVVRYEVTDLAAKIPGSSSPVITKRLFNAALALIDDSGAARPYLAEALPQLNTDTWRVLPDGRMETTYTLRPGLTWHDGQPLTADDFVFALQVYANRAFSVFNPRPQDRIEGATAPDAQTLVIRWSAPYAGVSALIDSDFDPLPRHILETDVARAAADPSTAESVMNLPFWTNAYVGAGPYKLDRWAPGAQIEGSAFAGHALGQPKIEHVVVRIISDENTVLSTVLAGEADFTADFTLRFEHALVLKREWESAGRGVVYLKPSSAVTQMVQFRPEYVGHPGLLDVRVRRALAHAIDRQALNEGLFEDQGFVSGGLVPPTAPFFADVDRAIAKYPYDPRRSEQVMAEAGYAKDQDGIFANAAGERFWTDIRVTEGPEFERGQAILVDTWRRAGFDVRPSVLAAAQARDSEARQTFPGMASRGGGTEESSFTTGEIGSRENRWRGGNRGGWSDPAYDRLYDAFLNTLDGTERTGQVIQMMKLISEQLPVYTPYFAIQVNTHVSGLRGPDPGTAGFGESAPGTLPYWNIHEWELTE